jgi:hypothetical protein
LKRWNELDMGDLMAGAGYAGRVAVQRWRWLLGGVAAIAGLCLLAGALVPFDPLAGPCLEQLSDGRAPSSLWRYNPMVQLRLAKGRDALLQRSRSALSLGQPLDAARAAAQELAFANACRPRDPQAAALLAWAAYYQSAKHPAPGLGEGLRRMGERCRITSMGQRPLLTALCAAGVVDPLQAERCFDCLGNAFKPLNEAFRGPDLPENAEPWGYEQELAFNEFRFQPTCLARHLPALFAYAVPQEQERARAAQLAVIQAWEHGVSPAAQALGAVRPDDPWLAAVGPGLGAVAAAKGKEMNDLAGAIKTALIQPGTGPMTGLAQSDRDAKEHYQDTNWEGWVAGDADGSRMPRVDFQHWIEDWALTSRPLPMATVIDPPVLADGTLSQLSGALAVLANDAAGDLPQPLWSGIRARPVLEQLGALVPGAVWTDKKSLHLQERLAAVAILRSRLREIPGGIELSACLSKAGTDSAWVKKRFLGQHLVGAPGWLAMQALALSGFHLGPADAKALARPLFNEPSNLREFAAALGGYDPTFGQDQWFARLYQREPSLPLLEYCTFDDDAKGEDRWDLIAAGLQREPWHWRLKLDYAEHELDILKKQRALNDMKDLLKQDPGQPDILEMADRALFHIGFMGERIALFDAALSITGRAPLVLVAAANSDSGWGWYWRGYGFSETISAPGSLFLLLAERRAKALALEARDKEVGYAPEYESLIKAGMVLDDPDSEEDDYLRASALVDPEYKPTFDARRNELNPKWRGTADKMIAFSRFWKDAQWRLPIDAQTDLAYEGQKARDYRHQPAIWAEIQGAFMGHLESCPMDLEAMADFGYWAYWSARQEDAVRAVQALWSRSKESSWALQQKVAFYDGIGKGFGEEVDDSRGAEEYSPPQVWRAAFYDRKPDYWDVRGKAMQKLCERYPENLDFLNDLASLSYHLKLHYPCAWAMGLLKGRREGSYWSAQEFKKAQDWLDNGANGQVKL